MADLLDLFDDGPPAPAQLPTGGKLAGNLNPTKTAQAKAPFIDFSQRDGAADARQALAAHRAALAADSPCGRPVTQGDHKCRVGGGLGSFSDDHGHSWFCRGHRPDGFLPGDRVGTVTGTAG